MEQYRISRRIYQVSSLLLLSVSVYIVFEAQNLNYYTPLGPGAGFFPFWLGLLMAALSMTWFWQATLQPVDPIERPEGSGVFRILALLVALIVFTLMLSPFGYRVSMLVFLLFILVALGRQHPLLTVVVALAGSFGVYYVFREWLGVYLPTGTIDFIEHLGL